MSVTAVDDSAPRPRRARTAFTGPVKWYVVECGHYAPAPSGRGRGALVRSGTDLVCDVCEQPRRAVKPA